MKNNGRGDYIPSLTKSNRIINLTILFSLFGICTIIASTNGNIKNQIAKINYNNILPPNSILSDNIIKGKVIDSNGEPIIGANVIVEGTTNGTITDDEGKFSLQVDKGQVLIITYVGYIDLTIKVGNQKSLVVTLKEDSQLLDELVVVGYGTMKKKDLTGAVTRANIDVFKESGNVSILQSLQGSVAGLDVGATTKAGQEASFDIRGTTSISGESKPLVVVDGVVYRGRLIDLNPADIESIDILKDASSAAIYGSQAANGVILVTTHKGQGAEGKPLIEFSGSYSFQSPANELKPLDIDDYDYKVETTNIFLSRTPESGYLETKKDWDPTSVFLTNKAIDAYKEGRYTDWRDIIVDNMHTQNYNVSISNNTKSNSYLISLGYTDQSGYLKNEDYSRINARINIDSKILDWLKIGAQTFFTLSDNSGLKPTSYLRFTSPYETCYDAEGKLNTYIGSWSWINPILVMDADNKNKRNVLFGNLYAEINFPFLKGLSYKINYANNYTYNENFYYQEYAKAYVGEAQKQHSSLYEWSLDNILSYKKEWKKNKIDATVVYGLEKRSQNSTTAHSESFANGVLGYNNLGAGDASLQKTSSGAWEESSLYGMMRLFYAYQNKYMVTGTIRRDGFSGFGANNKYGVFPSLSLAWVISQERFMDRSRDWLDNLKLRASYGTVGNRTLGRYQTLAKVAGNFGYISSDETPLYTQKVNSLPSPNLKWETTTGINIGIDISIFNRINASIEYYNTNTSNLLYNVDIPDITGYAKFPDNLGKLNNYGVEFSVTSTNINSKDFKWTSTLNFSRNRNKLKSLLGIDNDGDGKEDDLISQGLFINKSLDAIYDYEIDGMWQMGDDIPDGYTMGAYKVVDQNLDGKITPDDKKIIGYKTPAYTIGIGNSLTYKDFNLNLFIVTEQGGKNHFMNRDFYDFNAETGDVVNGYNFPQGLDYWTPENPNARYERPKRNISSGIAGHLYAPRNYVRLKDISLSYTLPRTLLSKIHLQNVKFYLSGKNLLTFTHWNGWDPETGASITINGLPVFKSVTLGTNIKF